MRSVAEINLLFRLCRASFPEGNDPTCRARRFLSSHAPEGSPVSSALRYWWSLSRQEFAEPVRGQRLFAYLPESGEENLRQ